MYKYEISGDYFEYDDESVTAERKHFDFEVKAPDSTTAMQIALGRILLNTENAVKLGVIHNVSIV